jgi:hypothetical protein
MLKEEKILRQKQKRDNTPDEKDFLRRADIRLTAKKDYYGGVD